MRDSSVKRWSRAHAVVFRLTRGRIGKRLVDNDMLLLTTIGAVSGKPHTVPLLYLRDGDRLVVIASYGGRDRHPDWLHNLAKTPHVSVELPGKRLDLVARTATPEERSEWWPRVEQAYDGYVAYQSRTAREIPVVFLDSIP